MKTIRRFDVLSVMKLAGVIYGVIGLVGGIFFAMFAALGFFAEQGKGNDPFSGPAGVLIAVVFAVVFPVVYGIIGALGAGLMSALYNVTSNRLGGIRVDVEDAPAEAAVALQASN